MNMRLSTLVLASALSIGVNAAQKAIIDDAQRAAFGIETAIVQPGQDALSKPYPAKVTVPNAQHRVVSAPLDGVIETLLVAEGEHVAKGQPLARLRSQGLLDRQAAYLESRTRRVLSGETLARDRQLYNDGIIARRRLLESQSAHRELVTAEARDRQALTLAGMPEAAVAALKGVDQLSTTLDVVAPLDGVVLEQLATAGQRLAAADPLYRLGDLSTLWIEVHVPLDEVAQLGAGSEVQLSPGLVAKVITIGRMVHGTDQGVLVRAEVDSGAERLRPGQFVEARLVHTADSAALRVPAAALLRIDGADQVFVERDDGYEAVPVDVISREADEVIVKGALSTSERVVISGTVALKAALLAGGQ